MKDFQLYQQILGLAEPWVVKNVTLKPKEREVEVEVGCTESLWGCPQCARRMHVHEWERRSWRHLDSCQFKTVIVADVPRVKCEEHGSQVVAAPWAEKYGRFTRLDEDGTTVDYAGPGRKQESLDAYWKQLTKEQLEGIEAVAMDMWEPFVLSTTAHVPQGAEKIVHDPFHMMQHMNRAVNDVRKAEHRTLTAQGDDTLEGTRWLWLYGRENIPEGQRPAFDALKSAHLLTARAWALKETLRNLWLYKSEGWARKHFQRWHGWAVRSRLEPVKKVARMLTSRLANILTYCKSRLSNGPLEGLNNKIQGLVKKAYGYRNKRRFINDIYFHCGRLDLYPSK